MTAETISSDLASDRWWRHRQPSQYPKEPRLPPNRDRRRSPPTQARPRHASHKDTRVNTRRRGESSTRGVKNRDNQFAGGLSSLPPTIMKRARGCWSGGVWSYFQRGLSCYRHPGGLNKVAGRQHPYSERRCCAAMVLSALPETVSPLPVVPAGNTPPES